MCYSAQIWSDYRKYVRHFGAAMDLREFVQVFWQRRTDSSIKVPKAMEDAFADPQTDDERRIAGWIEEHRAQQATKFEQLLFQQRTRLVEAERKLQAKVTKAATDNQRIARTKSEVAQGKLADLRRREWMPDDSRIFPGHYASVMVMEDGKRVIKPMRYQCRPAGAPAFYDTKFPGTYNARRDNLQGQFWKPLFGRSHGLLVVNAFYENVPRHMTERRALQPGEAPENLVLEFRPTPTQDLLVACLWSRWSAPSQPDLLSFAAITDDPPEEIALAGHDRCIVPLQASNVDRWLQPEASGIAALYAILDDRPAPRYEWRLAA